MHANALHEWVERGLIEKTKPIIKISTKRVLSLSPDLSECGESPGNAEKPNGGDVSALKDDTAISNGTEEQQTQANVDQDGDQIMKDAGSHEVLPEKANELVINGEDVLMDGGGASPPLQNEHTPTSPPKDEDTSTERSKENGSQPDSSRSPFDPLSFSFTNRPLLCIHGDLDPNKSGETKYISLVS